MEAILCALQRIIVVDRFEHLVITGIGLMGICASSRAIDRTVKLIMEDGRLKELSEPVKVEEILREKEGFFVCHSDCMAFDHYLTPLNPQHLLQLDELYFVLPEIKLKYPLPASEMASLAIKVLSAFKDQSLSRVIPLEKNVLNCSQNHRFPSRDRLEDFRVAEGTEHLKARNVGYELRAVNKYKRSASRGSKASRNAWKTTLATVPEGFA